MRGPDTPRLPSPLLILQSSVLTEAEAMRRALDLAWRGWGRVHPNPMVGAVLLRDGELAGEGWHAEFGGPHAEVVVLEQAAERSLGATLVLSLEPCAHVGKQPPCAPRIIAAKVRRVVAALEDPNPVAAGGAALLREAGIEVELGLLAEAARHQNAAFLHQFALPERPWVALKLSTTVDGRIADYGGRSRWISGEQARDYVHWLRAGFDAIGVGGHTARVDDASLTVRGVVVPRVPPLRVVFAPRADLPLSSQLVRTADRVPVMVVAGPPASPQAVQMLTRAGVRVLLAPTLSMALAELRQLGVGSLLVEGGGRLAGALLAEGLVDRYYWIQSPLWLGEGGVPAVQGLPSSGVAEGERWHVVERRALGEDTLLVLDREPCSPES